MEPQYNFYGVEIGTPLSLAHNTRLWAGSTIGQLYAQSNGQVYIREIKRDGLSAKYGWRVVDAYYSQEDSIMTYFRAFGLNGEFLGQAAFGVSWGSVPDTISGGFEYQPEFGNRYYVPVMNNFPTPNAGGYTAQVLCRNYPSEGIAFGLDKRGKQHRALVISWRLFELGAAYPNDLNLEIR